ncbi:hypothetical protein HMPREF0078_1131 [Anaerococcus vaginalis ATCC 51170]|uniref:Uncharacterized protein n=1 Tax=Anaerococcus vaginalis ATCC 51170 TaxID=655811 RepID=C7HUW8_9FIRM|nr:hypothetical protein HMPREF0078_1131 [Anaerococcus vaginalis ATCC 51170]
MQNKIINKKFLNTNIDYKKILQQFFYVNLEKNQSIYIKINANKLERI